MSGEALVSTFAAAIFGGCAAALAASDGFVGICTFAFILLAIDALKAK